ncbi:MAG: DUF1761 domain-containing protein [Bacteroidia bacterium]
MWYGPIFGDKWMGLVGLDPATVEANPPGAGIWITNIIATVIPMYALAWFFDKLNVRTWSDGIIYGLLISFAFHFLSNMTGDMFAARPYVLSWITGGYDLVAFAIAGAILGGWQKKS